jgi:hypothetical protein
MVLKEVRRDSFEDFLRAQKIPGFFTKKLRGFFVNSSQISVYSPIALPSF